MSNEYNCHLEVAPQPLALTDCVTALIFNYIKDVKKYCQFKFCTIYIRPTLFDFLLHSHYLLTNVQNLSVTCKTSSNVKVIKGCSSCLYNFPCDCTLHTSNLTFSTLRYPCENSPSIKPALSQLFNMSLAQLIDPVLLFARPLGLPSTENSGRLLGISSNYAKGNSKSKKRLDQQHLQLHQSITQFTLPQGTHFCIYLANLVCSFVFTPVIVILVVVNCCHLRNLQQRRAVIG